MPRRSYPPRTDHPNNIWWRVQVMNFLIILSFPAFRCYVLESNNLPSTLFSDTLNPDVSSEAFMAVMFQVEILRFITPCSVSVGYQRFGGPCCLHLRGEVTSEMLVSYHNIKRRRNPEELDLNLYRRENFVSHVPHSRYTGCVYPYHRP